MTSSSGNTAAAAAISSPIGHGNENDSHYWEPNLPSMPVPYEEFQFSLDLPSTLSFEGTQFDSSELSMLGSPPFAGDTTPSGTSHLMNSFGSSGRSRPTSPQRSGPPSKPPPPPFDPPVGRSLFEAESTGHGSLAPAVRGQGSGSLFDPSERNFLSSFLEGVQDWEFDPSLPKDMPSFKDASMRAGLSENSNSPNSHHNQGLRGKTNNRRAASNGSGSSWSPHHPGSSGQTPPILGINTSRPHVDSQRASSAFGGLSGWSDVDEEDVSTTPTGTHPDNEGEVGRKRSASTANRNNGSNQVGTPESVVSNDTNDSRGHSAYNAFIISYAPPPNQHHQMSNQHYQHHQQQQQHPHHQSSPNHHQQNQQPFRPPPPSYASRIQMQDKPQQHQQQQQQRQSHQNQYPHLQSLQNQMYSSGAHNDLGLDGMSNAGKKMKTGHDTSSSSPIQRSNGSGGTSSQSPQNDGSSNSNLNHSSSSKTSTSTPNSTSSTAPARQLLTDSEKRQNHILSEQRRRNFIREGFKELVELLEAGRGFGARGLGLSSGDGTGVEDEGLDDRSEGSENEDGSTSIPSSKKKKKGKRAAPAGRRGRGKGRGRGGSAGGGGGSKSAVLFQAVDLIRWLEVKNSELERSCEEMEKWAANGGAEEIMQE